MVPGAPVCANCVCCVRTAAQGSVLSAGAASHVRALGRHRVGAGAGATPPPRHTRCGSPALGQPRRPLCRHACAHAAASGRQRGDRRALADMPQRSGVELTAPGSRGWPRSGCVYALPLASCMPTAAIALHLTRLGCLRHCGPRGRRGRRCHEAAQPWAGGAGHPTFLPPLSSWICAPPSLPRRATPPRPHTHLHQEPHRNGRSARRGLSFQPAQCAGSAVPSVVLCVCASAPVHGWKGARTRPEAWARRQGQTLCKREQQGRASCGLRRAPPRPAQAERRCTAGPANKKARHGWWHGAAQHGHRHSTFCPLRNPRPSPLRTAHCSCLNLADLLVVTRRAWLSRLHSRSGVPRRREAGEEGVLRCVDRPGERELPWQGNLALSGATGAGPPAGRNRRILSFDVSRGPVSLIRWLFFQKQVSWHL